MVTDGIGIAIDASGEGRYGYGMRMGLGDSQFDFSLLPEVQVNPLSFLSPGLLCSYLRLMVIGG